MPQLAQHLRGASPAKWTYEDFLLFSDDGKRHELIDGEHTSPVWDMFRVAHVSVPLMSPFPFTKHQGFVRMAELSAENRGVLTTPLLSGMEIKLAEIFESII